LATTIIPSYRGVRLCLTGAIHALLYKDKVYPRLLADCDAILYVLSAAKTNDFANKEDFDIFYLSYQVVCPQKPVITLLNDMWCGKRSLELFAPTEIGGYLISGSPIIETKLGRGCNEESFAVLDMLLEKILQGEEEV
jgi:hypothetical protein